MNQQKVRSSFIEFFKQKGHSFVPSSSLVPQQDPTIMFTNSGMNQFKDIFLSLKEAKYSRVCNSQKCIRLSGKHNDLEEVGVDTYHHTFFEMLGNWSFGDYYKKEAISWAWELITEVWKLPKEKLYATVYQDDQESYQLWKEVTDIVPEQIMYFGAKDNFWEMAETGPCGPCSEIHFDTGEQNCTCPPDRQESCKHNGGGVNQDCARYIEIWNLVFIQYNRGNDGQLTPLKKVHVDTGMGFERICAILQKKNSNYDTDVFKPLFDCIEKLSDCSFNQMDENGKIAFRVIADHIRAISFSIADGVIPSNEGRGYVIRRILRRAYRYGRNLNLKDPFLYKIVPTLVTTMGDFFPEIKHKQKFIEATILQEEKGFHKTLDKGLVLFSKLLDQEKKTQKLSGVSIFQLYDTYGFPLDLTSLLAKENGYEIDEAGFNLEMEKQKKMSRKDKTSTYDLTEIVAKLNQSTDYMGDSQHHTQGKLLTIIREDQSVSDLDEGVEGVLIFDQVVFYGESGGQVGDIGEVYRTDGTFFEVRDTQKIQDTYLIHGKVLKGSLKVGETYQQTYDLERREMIRKNHSATHLLHQALIENLGDHVKQAGSLVGDEKLRFDFNHFKPISANELQIIENRVNQIIRHNLPIQIEEMPFDNATQKGAKAFFEEKYGDRVRVVSMGDYSIELCGGSHVHWTSEIGGLKIIHETSVASGIRRVEAITGATLVEDYLEKNRTLEEIRKILQIDQQENLISRITQIKEEVDKLQGDQLKSLAVMTRKAMQNSKKQLGSFSLFLHHIHDDNDLLLKFVKQEIDDIKNQNPLSICFFAISSNLKHKVTFLAGVGSSLKNHSPQIKAGELVKEAAKICDGSGGGRDDFAQAGGKNIAKLEEAMEWVENHVQGLIQKS